jgi:hypothetical protein
MVEPQAPTVLNVGPATLLLESMMVSTTDGVVVFALEVTGAVSVGCDNFVFFFFFRSAIKGDINFMDKTKNVEKRTYLPTQHF